MSDYNFDMAFKNAFPPPAPYKPYSYDKLVRDVKTTKLAKTAYKAGKGGKLVPIPKRTVTVMGLVVTYAFVAVAWTRIMINRSYSPISLLSSFEPTSPGKPVKGAFSGRRTFDPYGDFAFHVQIEGIGAGAFQKFDGIDVEIDEIEYMDSLDTHPHKRPGIHRYGNLKLTKGVIANKAMWDWCQKIMSGKIERKNGTIHVLNDKHDKNSPEISYNFIQAWPRKWTGLRLDGKGSATLVEEIELVVDYVTRSK